MQTILLFGAGKSATSLIEYLGKCCDENKWQFIVCDTNLAAAQSKIKGFDTASAVSVNVADEMARQQLISKASLVISMLPPTLHILVAKDCVHFEKSLLTASYIDDKIKSLQKEIEEKGLLFLGEMGLDPGIDHMSAMKIIDEIKSKGGIITSFKSHCGGLVAPESDDNPWHYKITWNPRNVITAGSAGAIYRENENTIQVNYGDIFKDESQVVDIPGLSALAWYANRDSLSYIDTYQLHGIETFLRTTLRYPSFSKGWNQLVQMDFTNITDANDLSHCLTFADWWALKTAGHDTSSFSSDFLQQVDFLGMRNNESLPAQGMNSGDLLQYLMEEKLKMDAQDKDMIVMLHEIEYTIGNENKLTRSSLIVKGDDELHTAMAKTVGLPLGIAAKLILQNKINLKGLHIPVIAEIYEPVLEELSENGIMFHEETTSL